MYRQCLNFRNILLYIWNHYELVNTYLLQLRNENKEGKKIHHVATELPPNPAVGFYAMVVILRLEVLNRPIPQVITGHDEILKDSGTLDGKTDLLPTARLEHVPEIALLGMRGR